MINLFIELAKEDKLTPKEIDETYMKVKGIKSIDTKDYYLNPESRGDLPAVLSQLTRKEDDPEEGCGWCGWLPPAEDELGALAYCTQHGSACPECRDTEWNNAKKWKDVDVAIADAVYRGATPSEALTYALHWNSYRGNKTSPNVIRYTAEAAKIAYEIEQKKLEKINEHEQKKLEKINEHVSNFFTSNKDRIYKYWIDVHEMSYEEIEEDDSFDDPYEQEEELLLRVIKESANLIKDCSSKEEYSELRYEIQKIFETQYNAIFDQREREKMQCVQEAENQKLINNPKLINDPHEFNTLIIERRTYAWQLQSRLENRFPYYLTHQDELRERPQKF